MVKSQEWPFSGFCEELFNNLFNPSWEVSVIVFVFLSLQNKYTCFFTKNVYVDDETRYCHIVVWNYFVKLVERLFHLFSKQLGDLPD